MRSISKLLLPVLAVALAVCLAARGPAPVHAVAAIASAVTIAGDLQSELGCGGDWNPACVQTHLAYDANDDVWQGTWNVPAGGWEYKAALNNSWTESYGPHGQQTIDNLTLTLGATASVKFYCDDKSHWVTDNHSAVIAIAAGSFQSELGCTGDWDPACLRAWLQDLDGDGIYTFVTEDLPGGVYEAKVAINESWEEHYGQGGTPGGANLHFSVPSDGVPVSFSYNANSHVLTIVSNRLFLPLLRRQP